MVILRVRFERITVSAPIRAITAQGVAVIGFVSQHGIAGLPFGQGGCLRDVADLTCDAERIDLTIDTDLLGGKRWARLIIAANESNAKSTDPKLVELIAKAHRARDDPFSGTSSRGNAISNGSRSSPILHLT